jgi:hypothetical protein
MPPAVYSDIQPPPENEDEPLFVADDFEIV